MNELNDIKPQSAEAEKRRNEITWIPCEEQMPPVAKSVLFCTAESVNEGTWLEDHWHQYRWNISIKPEKVIAWADKPEGWNEKTN